jgi:hypothetical protein
MPNDQLTGRVTGIDCTSTTACVVSTDSSDVPKVFAATNRAVGAVLIDGAAAQNVAMTLGGVPGFVGLSRTRRGLMARWQMSGLYATATGDATQPSNWTMVRTGMSEGSFLPGNSQEAMQVDANGNWLFLSHQGYVYSGTGSPGPTMNWTKIWSPTAEPPIPTNFLTMLSADPTLCDQDVTTSMAPHTNENAWISPDLSIVLYPSGGINQAGAADPGVCISLDKGVTFHLAHLPDLPLTQTSPGPTAITCLDNNRCFAFSGLSFQPGTGYVYYTTNAMQGAASTWTKATLPAGFATSDSAQLRTLFFAPDGIHGWIAGMYNRVPLLLRTTDSGHTWTDVSVQVQAATSERLWSGFALDADNVWLGGEYGAFLYTDTASH